MLKTGASGVLGPLSPSGTQTWRSSRRVRSRNVVYAPRAQGSAAVLDLAPPNRLRAGERAFLNILPEEGEGK